MNDLYTDQLYGFAQTSFEAARWLDGWGLAADIPSHRLHGHSFQVRAVTALENGTLAETAAWAEHVNHSVSGLNYRLLNECVTQPSDVGLVHWLTRQLSDPRRVILRSAPDRGIDLSIQPHHTASSERAIRSAWRQFEFEAAHRLPKVPANHPCGRMHGHHFVIRLHQRLTLDAAEKAHAALGRNWQPLYEQLHYHCLNDIAGLENPTSELLAFWLWQKLHSAHPLTGITVYETPTSGCYYNGYDYRIWTTKRFEAAVCLMHSQEPRYRQLHGHSYRITLHLTAPLDTVMGWTVDYGDIKNCFQPIYQQLDHHRLDEVVGETQADGIQLLRWVRHNIAPALPYLDRLDLAHLPNQGVILCWHPQTDTPLLF